MKFTLRSLETDKKYLQTGSPFYQKSRKNKS